VTGGGNSINPIGIIHTPYATKETCPIQPLYSSGAIGRVEVFEKYADGLKDIETFSHVYLLFLFDRAGEIKLVRATFLDDEPHGIYASRHPCRPNGIGMSIVKLLSRQGNVLTVEGVDMLDKTPLIDIKPYIPKFDVIDSASEGWTAGKQWRPKSDVRE
jgi:tRNA-Thr(GGU) m(6)t(6)A37 methyltransferase TsaA